MYRQILCPVDGSPTSNCGMHEAISLAKNQNAKLRFLHIVDISIPILDTVGEIDVLQIADVQRAHGKDVLKKAERVARKAGVAVDSKIIEAVGARVYKSVVSEAEQWPADLIVMGTHGLRGIERLIIGSDAEVVVRLSPVPVLLVKANEQSGKTS